MSNGDAGREAGAAYLDSELKKLGFYGHSEIAKLSGITEGMISKYRTGKAMPTVSSLRRLVNGMKTRADQMKIPLDQVSFFLKFGLITREDLDQEPLDDLYQELIDLDYEAGLVDPDEQRLLRRQIRHLINGTREDLDRIRENAKNISKGNRRAG